MANNDQLVRESISKERYERTMKLVVWLGIAASVMVFGGLVSAIIVSKGDKFWVSTKLPPAFLISTIIIIISSLTLVTAIKMAKKNKQSLVKILLGVTLLLGVSFSISQWEGWKQFYDLGRPLKGGIYYSYGAYGSDYVLLKDGEEISHNGQNYLLNGTILDNSKKNDLLAFAHSICGDNYGFRNQPYHFSDYGKPYSIQKISEEGQRINLSFENKKLFENNTEISRQDQRNLFQFAYGIYRDRPFFVPKGEYGKDFSVNLNGEKLEFENRQFFFPARDLPQEEIERITQDVYQGGKTYAIEEGEVFLNDEPVDLAQFETYLDLNDGIQVHLKNGKWTQLRQELNHTQYAEFYQSSNISSSFIYALTAVHLLHILVALIFLIVIFFRALQNKYTENNQLGIKAVGIFWHFLGVLWVFLYLFLQNNH